MKLIESNLCKFVCFVRVEMMCRPTSSTVDLQGLKMSLCKMLSIFQIATFSCIQKTSLVSEHDKNGC